MTNQLITTNTTQQIIQDSFTNIWTSSNATLDLSQLVVQAELLQNYFLDLGNTASQQIDNPNDVAISLEERYKNYQILFYWFVEVKHFMVAWRDITFEQYKGEILKNDKKNDQISLADFKVQAGAKIEVIIEDLIAQYQKYTTTDHLSNRVIKQSVRKWENLENPFPVYKLQIIDLVQQCQKCQTGLLIFQKELPHFHKIEALVYSNMSLIYKQLYHLDEVLKNLLQQLENTPNRSLNEQLVLINNCEQQVNFDNLQTGFSANLEKLILQLSKKIELPITAEAGIMTVREVELQAQVRQWIQFEIKPLLYEIWEIRDLLTTSAKVVFLNLRSQISTLKAQQNHENTHDNAIVVTTQITNTFLPELNRRLKEL